MFRLKQNFQATNEGVFDLCKSTLGLWIQVYSVPSRFVINQWYGRHFPYYYTFYWINRKNLIPADSDDRRVYV